MEKINFEDALVVEPAKVSILDELPIGSVIDYEGDTVPEGFEEVENIIGSCACFSKTDVQDVAANQRTTILFNTTDYVDNDCFELQSDGSVKVLKDINRVLITFVVRSYNGTVFTFYPYSFGKNNGSDYTIEDGSTFSGAIAAYSTILGSCILRTKKNGFLRLDAFTTDGNGRIAAYNKQWCAINITVLN